MSSPARSTKTCRGTLNYNVMFSPRGLLMLCQTEHEFRALKRTSHANRLAGLDCRMITPAEVKEIVPIINDDPNARYPILGAYYQPRGGTARHDAVAWGYARGADQRGVDIIQNCEVLGIRREGRRVSGVETTRGLIGTKKIAVVTAGHTSRLMQMAGVAHADRERVPAGARLRADQAGHRLRRHGEHGAWLHLASPTRASS